MADMEAVRTAVLHGKKDIRIEDRPPPACSGTDLIVKPEAVKQQILSGFILRLRGAAAACPLPSCLLAFLHCGSGCLPALLGMDGCAGMLMPG